MARGIRYEITSGFDARGVKSAQQSLIGFGKSALKSAVGIGSASVAISKLNQFLKESVVAAVNDQRAQENLAKTLQNAGWGAAANGVHEYIGAMQLASGVSEDEIRPAFLQLFNALGSVSKAQDALTTAMDASRATGKDLASVTAAIAKAAAGSNTAISRLGLGIKKADLATMSFDQILAAVEKKFKGSTATAAETMAGKMDRLRIAAGEAKEEIGKGLVDAFQILANEGGQDIDSLTTKMVGLGTTTGDVFRGIAVAWNGLSNLFAKTQLGKLLNLWAGGTGSGAGSFVVESMPIIGPLIKGLKAAAALGEEERKKALIGTGGSYFTVQAQKKLEADAAARARAEAKRLAAAKAADLARARALEAQKKKQAAMDKAAAETAMKYDVERAGLFAAMSREQSSDTQQRLKDLAAINTQQYASALGLMTQLDIEKLIDEKLAKMLSKQQQLTKEVDATTAAYAKQLSTMNASAAAAGLGRDFYYSSSGSAAEATAAAVAGITNAQAASALTNMFPEADRASAGSGNYGYYGSQPSVTVNVSGSLVAQADLEQAIAGAVNSAARSGVAYSQIFSRL